MDDTDDTTITESSIEDPPQLITSNILDLDYNIDPNETTTVVVEQLPSSEPDLLPTTLSLSSESEIINNQNLSESVSSIIIPGESPSSISITLPPELSSSSSSTSNDLNPIQHPIFALPMHQQNPSQVIIPPLNEQSPAFMIPLPTIYVPIIPLNPWQMATLKSRVKHQLKLKRKASSSSSISHRLKISRKKIQKRARISSSQDSVGEDQQEHSTSSYFQENENDDEFLVVVDVDMSEEDDDEDSDSTDEDEDENENDNDNENKIQNINLKSDDLSTCHSSKTSQGGNGDGDNGPSTSTSSSSTFSLGHRTSSRNLLHQVKELSQQLLAKLTDSEVRLQNKSHPSVQNIEIVENRNIQETSSESDTKPSISESNPPNSSLSNVQSISTLSPPSSSSSASAPPNSSSNTLETKDTTVGSKSEEGETETEAETEVEAETTEEDPEFEEEYEPVDPEETENQNQADEDDEEPEGTNSTDEATTSNSNTRNQPDLFKGCLALSSEVILSYGRISSLHEKLHAILYGEHHHVVIGGFLCSLSYTFKAFPTDYNNNNNSNSINSSSNSKETFNDNNTCSSSSTTVNCSHQNINNNNYNSRYTGNNNKNNITVVNGYCIGFYLDDLDPNTFEMEIQDGRIKVAGRRDDIDLTLDIHIAAPVHIEDIIVDHFKATSLLWLKIYF